MRLAYFTPLPPSKSGIADYNSELLPYLAKGAEISVFVAEADELRENSARADFSIHDAKGFDEIHVRRPFDLCVYHQGNNQHHEYIYDRATRTPGLLVMHESCLHHLIGWKTLGRKDKDAYMDEMFYAYGRKGERVADMRAQSRRRAKGAPDRLGPPIASNSGSSRQSNSTATRRSAMSPVFSPTIRTLSATFNFIATG
jgi:hypothetical protein